MTLNAQWDKVLRTVLYMPSVTIHANRVDVVNFKIALSTTTLTSIIITLQTPISCRTPKEMSKIFMGTFFIAITFIRFIQLLATPKAPFAFMSCEIKIMTITILATSSKSLIRQSTSMIFGIDLDKSGAIPTPPSTMPPFVKFSCNTVNTLDIFSHKNLVFQNVRYYAFATKSAFLPE
jgi:hypothetical protein